MTPTRTRRGLASLLAASMLLVSSAAIAHAGVTVADNNTDDSVVDTGLLPSTSKVRPIAGHPCDTEGETAERRSVVYTCAVHGDAALLWTPDPATVVAGGPCLVRGEQAHATQIKTSTTEPVVLACQMRNDVLTWAPASRLCLTAIAARNEVASDYMYAREQVTMLSERLREVKGTERLSLNRQIVPLRTQQATMSGLLTKLATSTRTTCGR